MAWEAKFDDDLHGVPGHMLTSLDAKRHVLGSVVDEPEPGENLVLSIDANIQYMAEKALDAQMLKMKAAHGTVVVQDPHTGADSGACGFAALQSERFQAYGCGGAAEPCGERRV